MKYSECFYTIQGEGRYLGVPSVFFRTSYCNLRCSWCDTPYTSWTPENKQITIEDAFKQIMEFDCTHVVITGGEPFVQLKELEALCRLLHNEDRYITIETNATIYGDVDAQFISMSPKLRNSNPEKENKHFNNHSAKRINAKVIELFYKFYDCQIKFVVDNPSDMVEIDRIQRPLGIPPSSIVLMPQGITAEELRPKQEWLIEICKEHGYTYSPRLHVDIWGNKRGV